MYSLSKEQLPLFLKNNLDTEIILVDLGEETNYECDDIIYLVNPSLFTINKLLFKQRDAFIRLKGEKVVLVNSLLSEGDVNQFSKEANISIYYNLPPLNDRINNHELEKFLLKLGIVSENNNKNNKKGLFGLFK